MIRRIFANRASFRPIVLEPGFNLILGRKAKDSGQRQSANSIGKSTFLRTVHYLLGSSPDPGRFPRLTDLHDWEFSADLELDGHQVTVSRGPSSNGEITVVGAPATWGGTLRDLQPSLFARDPEGARTFSLEEWTELLGRLLFRIPADARPADARPADERPAPSFRQLIQYFLRIELGACETPFAFSKGSVWQSRVAEAYLFGLAWELPAEASRIEEGLKQAKQYFAMTEKLEGRKKAQIPQLEAEKARVALDLEKIEEELRSFRVHERYQDLEREANTLTAELSELNDQAVTQGRLYEAYRDAVHSTDSDVHPEVITRLYQEAGIWLPEKVIRRLDEVRTFHTRLLEHRALFLSGELERLQIEARERRRKIDGLDARRADLMTTLRTHRAMEHFARLQELAAPLRRNLAQLQQHITGLERLSSLETTLKKRRAGLEERANREHLERKHQREKATSLFSRLADRAFDRGRGELHLGDGTTRFTFQASLPGIRGEGVSKLATACVDLTLARLWAEQGLGPRLLIHDSRIFTGVDPRQAGAILASAFRESTELGYTYVATFNYDVFESIRRFLPPEFKEEMIRLELEDQDPERRLLGIAFEEDPPARGARKAPAGRRSRSPR